MIINFKIFESINRSSKPNLNDYVIVKANVLQTQTRPEIVSYINTHIGKIIEIKNRNGRLMLPTTILVEYDYPKYKIQTTFYDINDIKYWSKNYDELLPLLKATKYNVL